MSAGISAYPRLGSKAYSAHPLLLKWIAESSQRGGLPENPLLLQLGLLPSATETAGDRTPESLFGRHRALLGATGGGKEWTIARLIEQTAVQNTKVLLLDATGEFYTLGSRKSRTSKSALDRLNLNHRLKLCSHIMS